MKFLSFVENDVDSFLQMQLVDLARTLSKNNKIEVEYNFLSYYSSSRAKVFVSRFWDNLPTTQKELGLKSDIYLRSFGNYHYSDYQSIFLIKEQFSKSKFPKLSEQLFILLEDIRVQEQCLRNRNGMSRAFLLRNREYRKYYEEQISRHIEKKEYADAILCSMYILLTSKSDSPMTFDHSDILNEVFSMLQHEMLLLFEQKNTHKVAEFCLRLLPKIMLHLTKDLASEYFMIEGSESVSYTNGSKFEDLLRNDSLKNNDSIEAKNEDNNETTEDKLPTWHREISKPTESFLQFELEQGTKMNILGQTAKEADSGDQAMGAVQGSSQKNTGNDFSEKELLQQPADVGGANREIPYGKENRFAHILEKEATKPTQDSKTMYSTLLQEVKTIQKKLRNTIEKTLEQKRTSPRTNLYWGRLNKRLVPFLTDGSSRVFYKKQDPNSKIDAAFSLLVDCSASMMDKMGKTKLGIILFHETLSSLRIPHSVTGFWEDASEATQAYQPNYFHHIIRFENSLLPTSGPEILQLEPKEDNRDGFAIRVLTKQLMRRSEKQRFLFVFSDGEPAASDYTENGILDTYQAVLEARKNGIEVVGLFLSNGEIKENEKETMKNIYGKQHVIVPDVTQLQEYIAPLLKKMINKSML
jgi:nitric oxide reductase activation protein